MPNDVRPDWMQAGDPARANRAQGADFDALDDLADALGGSGSPANVVLVIRGSARVQDVATVLARLRLANVRSVQISAGVI